MALLESLDSALSSLFGQWNDYSTGLVTLLLIVITYRLFSRRDADVHPILLARQSLPSPVRNQGESAIYRAQAAPHGVGLNSGLNVRDPGLPKWSRGRNGDMRDIWRRAVLGDDDGLCGNIITLLGSGDVVEHDLGKVTKQINLIGRHIADGGGTRVAVYLPNSLEFLATLFGCIFIPHLTAILIPFPVSDDELVSMLKRSAADSVVAASPTSLPLSLARQALPSLRQVIWVDDPATEDEKTEAAPSVSVANWRHIIDQASSPADSELPALDVEHTPHDVVTFGVSGPKEPLEMVSFSQANLIAGIAGQLAALPTHERLRPSDLLLPLDSLASIHTLIITLAALYSNASLALAPASDPTADLGPLVSKLAPTVMVAGPEILLRTREASMAEIRSSTLARLSHRLATRSLTLHGVLPTQGPLPACSSHLRLSSGAGSRRLRLIFVAERAGSRDGHLTPDALTDLRALTGARVIHALAAARVAGAVSQTAFYDYQAETAAKRAHFGAPLTSLELYLRDSGPYQTTDEEVQGEIVVRGPCVAGGEARLGVIGFMTANNTLALA